MQTELSTETGMYLPYIPVHRRMTPSRGDVTGLLTSNSTIAAVNFGG